MLSLVPPPNIGRAPLYMSNTTMTLKQLKDHTSRPLKGEPKRYGSKITLILRAIRRSLKYKTYLKEVVQDDSR